MLIIHNIQGIVSSSYFPGSIYIVCMYVFIMLGVGCCSFPYIPWQDFLGQGCFVIHIASGLPTRRPIIVWWGYMFLQIILFLDSFVYQWGRPHRIHTCCFSGSEHLLYGFFVMYFMSLSCFPPTQPMHVPHSPSQFSWPIATGDHEMDRSCWSIICMLK